MELLSEDYSNLLHYLIYLGSLKKINDVELFKIIYIILNNKLRITNIYNIDLKLKTLKKNNIYFCFNYLCLLYNLNYEQERMTKLINYKKKNKLNLMDINILDKFKKIIVYIKSFNDTIFQILKYKKKYGTEWEQINTLEINKRLDLLIKFFGIKYLKENNFPVIEISDFDTFDFNKKISFYFNFLEKLEYHLSKIMNNYKGIMLDLDEMEILFNNLMNLNINEKINFST
ncbi:Hypothetical protein KVN_LOCUS183 [uncultured virus]|nr:Hypothetical protein KVN_LOCUS183 [uncultured virus]